MGNIFYFMDNIFSVINVWAILSIWFLIIEIIMSLIIDNLIDAGFYLL